MIDTAHLISTIEQAFAGVRLGAGISLHECEFADSGGSATAFRDRAKDDERNDWHRLVNDSLTEFQVTFSFTDLKGYRFYLPAYMIWTIQNFTTSNSIISEAVVRACDPDAYQFQETPFVAFFDARQLEAIILFLCFCSENDGPLDGEEARANLRKIRDKTDKLHLSPKRPTS